MSKIDELRVTVYDITEQIRRIKLDGWDPTTDEYEKMVWRRIDLHRRRAELLREIDALGNGGNEI